MTSTVASTTPMSISASPRPAGAASGRTTALLTLLPWVRRGLEAAIVAAAAPALVTGLMAAQDARSASAAWTVMTVAALTLGVVGLPNLLGLAASRTGWQRELLALQVVAGWLPFAVLARFYPTPAALTGWSDHSPGLRPAVPVLVLLVAMLAVLAVVEWCRRAWRLQAAREQAGVWLFGSTSSGAGKSHALLARPAAADLDEGSDAEVTP